MAQQYFQSSFMNYIGQSFEFSDGRSIKILDVKLRDHGEVHYWVTYEIRYSKNSIPKKLVMMEREFISNFGQLFFPKNPDKPTINNTL